MLMMIRDVLVLFGLTEPFSLCVLVILLQDISVFPVGSLSAASSSLHLLHVAYFMKWPLAAFGAVPPSCFCIDSPVCCVRRAIALFTAALNTQTRFSRGE
ncbi:hypothetical protein CHARACLAT_010581 [Characodon lateralis]|uniref:Secreted protein n=1 Tax=Characodon lateralis TaxID=208331 RepID=A0ABU7DZD4_9TELE|nr:hypothetical protein [Characodon lateralis]